MKKQFTDIKNLFPNLKVEEVELKFAFAEEVEVSKHLHISGLNGNPDLTLVIRDKDDASQVATIPLEELFLLKDILACQHDKKVHVLLSEISVGNYGLYRQLEKTPIEIKINYKKQDLRITLQVLNEESSNPLRFISNHLRGTVRYKYRRSIVLSIENFTITNQNNLEPELKLLLNSVLFDIEYNFNLIFEVLNIDSMQRRLRKKPKVRYPFPIEEVEFTYKKYTPELIDYFHTAEKVDYVPFKFICYFHIIEYFQDKSAFFIVREKLKNIILKPDFSMNVNFYVTQALNVVKQESEKHQTDKVKIQRVLRQFIDPDEIKQFLIDEELISFFEQECTIQCSKPLLLPALDFSTDTRFIETLTNRIYSMRCSIVHSNPDFDDKKAVPFLSTIENIDKLRHEVDLIKEVGQMIILKSIER